MARGRRRTGRGGGGGAAKPLAATSGDGCPVTACEEGSGPVTVIIAGGGLDDGRGYARLAARLKGTNRVVRLTRRGYRTDVARWRPVEVKDEVADVVALARVVGRPCYVFGHSAGGVEALEAALAAPECFDAIAVFEPAIDAAELPLGDPAATLAARQALDERRPARALEIFLRDMVGVPPPAAKLARLLAVAPRFRSQLIPGQIGDAEALERLGDRLAAYRGVGHHVLLVGGTRSPGHFGGRIELLHRVLPASEIRWLEGAGHTGPIRKAGDLAALLLADIATHVSV